MNGSLAGNQFSDKKAEGIKKACKKFNTLFPGGQKSGVSTSIIMESRKKNPPGRQADWQYHKHKKESYEDINTDLSPDTAVFMPVLNQRMELPYVYKK